MRAEATLLLALLKKATQLNSEIVTKKITLCLAKLYFKVYNSIM
jgi:hypothetical protein